MFNSNTTNVKVKLNVRADLTYQQGYSNTTNVKVKLSARPFSVRASFSIQIQPMLRLNPKPKRKFLKM